LRQYSGISERLIVDLDKADVGGFSSSVPGRLAPGNRGFWTSRLTLPRLPNTQRLNQSRCKPCLARQVIGVDSIGPRSAVGFELVYAITKPPTARWLDSVLPSW
jgi:hypothetical protein